MLFCLGLQGPQMRNQKALDQLPVPPHITCLHEVNPGGCSISQDIPDSRLFCPLVG